MHAYIQTFLYSSATDKSCLKKRDYDVTKYKSFMSVDKVYYNDI